ncbi:MAG TPA: hypothetical protein VK171_04855 [Fimbriimonas sp.]|nr:hypothetical protein [Fimbriimonas sp.]
MNLAVFFDPLYVIRKSPNKKEDGYERQSKEANGIFCSTRSSVDSGGDGTRTHATERHSTNEKYSPNGK